MKPNNGDVEPLIPSGLMLNGQNWLQMAQIVVVETDFQPATDGKPQPMSAQTRLDLGPLWMRALLVILSLQPVYSVVTASQMWNNGSLHWKEQMNIDSGLGLIGTVVFPEGELMTWSQLGDIWRPITAAALMVAWFCCTSECFLIRQRRSPGY